MPLSKEQLATLYANLVRARKLDERLVQGVTEGKTVSFFHSGQGEEAVGVGGCSFLRPDDYIYFHHRGHGVAHILAKGGSARELLAEHYGKATGSCGGVGAIHFADPSVGILGLSGTIGTAFPISAGWGLAAKKNGRGQVVVSFFGDGSANRGTLHEAMNLAAVWKLPIVWVCHNNLYAQFMPIRDAFPGEDIAQIAAAYRMPASVVDGQDVLAVHEAVQASVARARAGEGPSLVECKTYRYRAHVEGVADISHVDPRPAEEVQSWLKRDPIVLFRQRLLDDAVLSEGEISRIEEEAAAEIDAAERFALDSPAPDPAILQAVLYAD